MHRKAMVAGESLIVAKCDKCDLPLGKIPGTLNPTQEVIISNARRISESHPTLILSPHNPVNQSEKRFAIITL